MNLASSVRAVRRYGGFKVAAKALYHAAWQFFSDRWLNIRPLPLSESRGTAKLNAPSEDAELQQSIDMIEAIQVNKIGRQTRQYLNASFSGDRLLSEIGRCILKNDNGWDLLHTLVLCSTNGSCVKDIPRVASCLSVLPAGRRMSASVPAVTPRRGPHNGSHWSKQQSNYE